MTDFCYIPGYAGGLTVETHRKDKESGMIQSNQATALRARRASEIDVSGDPTRGRRPLSGRERGLRRIGVISRADLGTAGAGCSNAPTQP